MSGNSAIIARMEKGRDGRLEVVGCVHVYIAVCCLHHHCEAVIATPHMLSYDIVQSHNEENEDR